MNQEYEYGSPPAAGNVEVTISSGAQRSIKRPRPVRSCYECRMRKLRCNRVFPCSQCQKSQRVCRYAGDAEAANLSDASDAEVPEKAPKRRHVSASTETSQDAIALLEDHAARLERLEKIILGNAKISSPSSSSAPIELNLRNQSVAASSVTIRSLAVKGGLRTRYFGQNSTRVLLNLFDDAKEFLFSRDKSPDIKDAFMSIQTIHKTLQEEQRKARLPLEVFVDNLIPIQKRMADLLPKKNFCDHYVQIYMHASENLYRVVHIPSFMDQYENWWKGSPCSEALLPQLLAIASIGYRFLGTGQGFQHDIDGISIPTALALVRSWLDGLRGKQLIDFSTLQAEVILLMAQRMSNPKNQDTWTQLGLVVRMAMTMGLHRDPSEFSQKISPFWAEQRRKVWFTILELDLQVSMQCNMPSCLRERDFTCQPPKNLDDADLSLETVVLPDENPIDQPTDAQVQVYATSTLRHRFKVVDIINRMDSITGYREVLDCGTSLERNLEEMKFIMPKKIPTTSDEVGHQWATKVILDMHCRRALLGLYRPFALGNRDVPQQIATAYLRSSVIMLTYIDGLDTSHPNHDQALHTHFLVLRQDILQAAFSVCYYIKNAATTSDGSLGFPPPDTRSSKSDLMDESCLVASESSILLSVPRLVGIVQKVLNTMIMRIREIETDLKDIVALTVVLSMCQGGSIQVKRERLKKGLRSIIEAGSQAIRTSPDNIASMSNMSQTSPPLDSFQNAATYMSPFQTFTMTPPDVHSIGLLEPPREHIKLIAWQG